MRRLTAIRLAAVLLPSALLLHEGVYALAGGIDRSAHDYFSLLVPVIVAGAVSLGAASLLLPALGFRMGGGVRRRPFAIAAALILLFAVQEGAEALIFGGGTAQLAAATTASWALLPLAFAIGVIGAGAIELLERAGEGIARLLSGHRPPKLRPGHDPRPSIFNLSLIHISEPTRPY